MKIESTHEQTGLGIAAIILSVFFFSVTDTLAKWFGHLGYPPAQIVFFRYVFGLVPVILLIRKFGIDSLRTRRPLMHAVRACLIFSALVLFFRGIKLMPLAEAVAIAFTAPLFVTALSVPMLGEHVGAKRWCAVAIGFIGALIVLQPGTAAFRMESLIIVGSAFLFSIAMILTRRMSRTETSLSMFAYSTLGAGLISIPFLGMGWVPPEGEHLFGFALLGFVGGAAAFLVIVAYRNASASVIAPFDYTALVWTSFSGWLIWNERPGIAVWIGATVIIVSSLYIAHRETRPGAAQMSET